jgi:hypothetical protein
MPVFIDFEQKGSATSCFGFLGEKISMALRADLAYSPR